MSDNTTYTDEELKNLKFIKSYTIGPHDMDSWIRYTKTSDIIPEEFLNRNLILKNYPNFYDITCKVTIYNDNYKYNVHKVRFSVCEKSPGEQSKKKVVDSNCSEGAKPSKIYSPFSNSNLHNQPYGKKGSVNHSIVVKNLPSNYELNDLKYQLQDLFTSFIKENYKNTGKVESICKASVLTSNGISKGLAFVDFKDENHVQFILNSTDKFKIGFNILSIDKKKSK